MNLYFAAPNNKPDLLAVLKTEHKNVLFSYHYFKKKIEWLKEFRAEFGITTFIDSGAFSSHTQGTSIDLDAYIAFLHELKPEIYAGLDDMKDPQKTWDNQKIMEQAGLNPMPCFHMGENITWLEKYIEQYDYIALGGMVMNSNVDSWLYKVWNTIITKKPSLKVHGFGMTDQEIDMKYPFYSVDSSSYAGGVRFARMSLWSDPKKVIYDEEFWKYCRTNGIEYAKGQSIVGDLRQVCIGECCKAYISMIAHVNHMHEGRDFSYLKSQASLF